MTLKAYNKDMHIDEFILIHYDIVSIGIFFITG